MHKHYTVSDAKVFFTQESKILKKVSAHYWKTALQWHRIRNLSFTRIQLRIPQTPEISARLPAKHILAAVHLGHGNKFISKPPHLAMLTRRLPCDWHRLRHRLPCDWHRPQENINLDNSTGKAKIICFILSQKLLNPQQHQFPSYHLKEVWIYKQADVEVVW